MKQISLLGGGAAIVDDDDYDVLCKRQWRVQEREGLSYAVCGRGVLMHRLIARAKRGQSVDHVNGYGLDNRKLNLRLCSHAENMRNRKATGGSSKFKGVRLNRKGTWRAEIQQNGEYLHLGTFDAEEQAARQYDRAARVFFGKFARTNEMLGLL